METFRYKCFDMDNEDEINKFLREEVESVIFMSAAMHDSSKAKIGFLYYPKGSTNQKLKIAMERAGITIHD